MSVQRIASQSTFAEAIGFSAASATDNLVFTAGFTALDPDGAIVGDGDAYVQAVEALRKLTDALAQAGAGAADVVQTRVYLVNASDWVPVGRAHGDVFANSRPAATMVVVAELLDPRMLVEIASVAVRPSSTVVGPEGTALPEHTGQ